MFDGTQQIFHINSKSGLHSTTSTFSVFLPHGLCLLHILHILKLDETLVERLWGLTEMFPETVRTGAEVSAQYSVSFIKKLYRYVSEVPPLVKEQKKH